MIPQVVASERGKAQTDVVSARSGLKDCKKDKRRRSRRTWKGLSKRVIIPYATRNRSRAVSWVVRNTWNSAWISGDHPVRLNTPKRPIANQYCEGKVKRTSNRGVKQTLKPCAYKRSEHVKMWRRAFCIMNLRVTLAGKVKRFSRAAEAKASPNKAYSQRE